MTSYEKQYEFKVGEKVRVYSKEFDLYIIGITPARILNYLSSDVTVKAINCREALLKAQFIWFCALERRYGKQNWIKIGNDVDMCYIPTYCVRRIEND